MKQVVDVNDAGDDDDDDDDNDDDDDDLHINEADDDNFKECEEQVDLMTLCWR